MVRKTIPGVSYRYGLAAAADCFEGHAVCECMHSLIGGSERVIMPRQHSLVVAAAEMHSSRISRRDVAIAVKGRDDDRKRTARRAVARGRQLQPAGRGRSHTHIGASTESVCRIAN